MDNTLHVEHPTEDVTTIDSKDNITAALEESTKQLTDEQLRQLRRIYVTVRHNTVEPCGDKLDINREPRTNCPYCWFVFFNSHGELVQTADEVFQKEGRLALKSLRGTKFLKNFLRFMATLALMKEQLEAQTEANKEQNEQGTRGTDGNSIADEDSGRSSNGSSITEAVVNGREIESVVSVKDDAGQKVSNDKFINSSGQ